LFWDSELSIEEEEELIQKIAQRVHKHKLNLPAMFVIETFKPLSYIGSQMGRFFISPYLLMFGEEMGMTGEKIITLFEKRENVDKLITAIDELQNEEIQKEKERKDKEREAKQKDKPQKTGWRRFIPF
jgi:hypothetical protein